MRKYTEVTDIPPTPRKPVDGVPDGEPAGGKKVISTPPEAVPKAKNIEGVHDDEPAGGSKGGPNEVPRKDVHGVGAWGRPRGVVRVDDGASSSMPKSVVGVHDIMSDGKPQGKSYVYKLSCSQAIMANICVSAHLRTVFSTYMYTRSVLHASTA